MVLRSGMGYAEFEQITKEAFVNVAFDDYGIRGRKTNISRVAALTGLTRREISRIQREHSEKDALEIGQTISPSIVLQEWRTNGKFVDSRGRPMPLAFDGSKNSFSELVSIVSNSIPPGAMRTELKRVGSVSEDENGILHLKKKYFLDTDLDGRLAMAVRGQLRLHAETVLHNTLESEQENLRMEKIAYTTKLHNRDVPSFRRVANRELDDLVGRYAAFVDNYEALSQPSDQGSKDCQLTAGIGVYYFEEVHYPRDD